MADKQFDIEIKKGIADLIPTFLENRRKDAELLRAALAMGDLEKVRFIAHRITGGGTPYGFPAISDLGRRIERAAADGEESLLAPLIDEYSGYVARIS
jgi:HPt (histidine-containing phosphotransfer) domain-containing protein